MPKVSIIIPLFNKEEYISTTLDTVLGQEFSDYEVIIVNDGSTDSSLDIVNEYAKQDSRIKVYTIPNGGVSNARNVAMSYAAGDWIQFLDADDVLNSQYLEKALKVAEDNNVDIIFSNFEKINSQGQVLERVTSSYTGRFDKIHLMDLFMELQPKNGFFGFISNKLIRRELIEENNVKFPVGITLAEDLAFYIQLYQRLEWCYFIDENSFSYLQTDKNYLFNDNIDYRAQLSIQVSIRDWFESKNYYEKYKNPLDKRISDYIYYVIFHDNERGLGIKQAYHDIVDNPEIFRSLCGQESVGLQKRVLYLLKERRYKSLTIVFKVRNLIRGFYRRMRRNG